MRNQTWNDDSTFTSHWRDMRETTPEQSAERKAEIKGRLNDHVDDYLSRGGNITVLPSCKCSDKKRGFMG